MLRDEIIYQWLIQKEFGKRILNKMGLEGGIELGVKMVEEGLLGINVLGQGDFEVFVTKKGEEDLTKNLEDFIKKGDNMKGVKEIKHCFAPLKPHILRIILTDSTGKPISWEMKSNISNLLSEAIGALLCEHEPDFLKAKERFFKPKR